MIVKLFSNLFLFLSLFLSNFAFSNEINPACCGPIHEKASALLTQLDNMQVDRFWLAGRHINWETGMPDKPVDYKGQGRATHCSAFVAAAAKRLIVYVLRPPEHSQVLLASAQTVWLASEAARQAGWTKLEDSKQAQTQANQGFLVLVTFQSPNPKKPGHIAIVIPSEKTEEELMREGPQIMQAGTINYSSTSVKIGFLKHKGAWPNGVRYFSHSLN
jgi:hypothetical protein